MEEITDQLFEEVAKVYKQQKCLTDELLFALQFVFQAPLLPALDLIDRKSVTLIRCPSGRKVYQVSGSSGTPYTCFATSSFCSCPAYKFSVLKRGDTVMCKHLLAIRLSESMEEFKQYDVSDQEMASIITHMD